MSNNTQRRIHKNPLMAIGLVMTLFLLSVVFFSSSTFAGSNNNRQKDSAKKSCPIKCEPAKNAKDIRRHAACMARRAKVCR
ncbi:hypothetical protein MNBD_GAMMA12-2140 [hydrothermal vent metagenome]|uniref:Uncharacterized protein n=1 Tax=hydrothermal vent metagenome TaxID=652676 RepID=A0A3B0Y480_9ZZZZ